MQYGYDYENEYDDYNNSRRTNEKSGSGKILGGAALIGAGWLLGKLFGRKESDPEDDDPSNW